MKRLQKGFTLVEIIMVLGIASLITAAVFIAVSGAQRSARDTTRRADTQKLATAIEQWSANNNGVLPGTTGDQFDPLKPGNLFELGYLNAEKFKDPKSGVQYPVRYSASPTCTTNTGDMFYTPDSSNDSYTLTTCLEAGKYTYKP